MRAQAGNAMSAAGDRYERPNSVPWPPVIFGGIAVVAVVLHLLVPSGGVMPGGLMVRAAGAAVMAAGLGFDGAAMAAMRRHRANILPHRAATALVRSFPFSLSRNPIYLGNALLLLGAAFAFAVAWLLPAAIIAAALVRRLAIEREEAHLAARFGDAWRDYARKVPRWFGWRGSRG